MRNEGIVVAEAGTVALASGEIIRLDFDGNHTLASITATASEIETLVENRHAVYAPGGFIVLSARAVDSLQGGVIRSSGTLSASSLSASGGRIMLGGDDVQLVAGSHTEANGAVGGSISIGAEETARIEGLVAVNATAGTGGEIRVSGKGIVLDDGAQLSATGAAGGGRVLVGGNWQGGGDMPQATTLTMSENTRIDASATEQGDGGTVVLWSDVHAADSFTTAQGAVLARGGAQGGDGGKVETSGHSVDIDGFRVDTLAPQGRAGEWLIDPYDYTINAAQAATISNALNSSSVTVTTATNVGGYGSNGNNSSFGDINVNSAITKTSGSATTLTLQAHRDIVLNAGGTISASGGALNVKLHADQDNNGQGLIWFATNSLSTNGGWLQFGDNQWATLNGVSTRVGGDVFFTSNSAQSLNTAGGAVNIYGETIVANTAGLTINSANGNVTLHGLLNSGNQYSGISSSPLTWLQAFDLADNAANSYLATVTSRLENSIAARSVSYNSAWLGARRQSNGVWRWETGPEQGQAVGYTNWTPGEPNNCCGSPNGLGYGGENALQFTGANGQWNDLFDNGSRNPADWLNYYVRETNLAASPVTINAGAGAFTSGAIGGNKALASLNVTAASTTVTGNALISTGAQSYSGALTVNATGDLNVSATTLDITNAGQSLQLKATGNITHAAGMDVSTNGGSVTYWANSNTNGSGRIELAAGTAGNTTRIATNGGNITLGGGSNPLAGYASGTGGIGAVYGINLAGYSSLNAGSGSVSLRGASAATADQYAIGVRLTNSASVSGGNVTVNGIGSANSAINGNNWGVSLENGSSITGSGAVSVTGAGGGSNSSGGGNYGVYVSSSSITGTGSGAMTITGAGGGRSGGGAGNKGIYIFGGSTIRSAAGAMTLTGTGGFSSSSESIALESGGGQTNTLGSVVAGQQGGAITLRGDTFWFNPTSVNWLAGTGAATIESQNASFNGGFSTAGLTLGSSLAGLTIGRTTNAADVTIAGAASVAGPVAIHGGNIAINAGLISTGAGSNARITLKGTGNVTDGASGYVQTGSDGNGSLLLLGGNVMLDNSADNDVFSLAASGVSGLTYLDKAGLMIGTVEGVEGVSASGEVNIGTRLGSLSVTRNVATTSTSSNALTLNASFASAVRSDTNYNLLISGGPTLSVGNGGTGRLFTGGIAGSSGLTDLVGSGSGRFRYNSDEAATNYTLALGSGLHAIYREQPSITVSASDRSVTYGTPLTQLLTLTGGANGDTAAQALTTATVTLDGATSTAGHATVGTHTMTPTGGDDQLGYAIAGYTGGTLTVTPKQLTVTYSGIDKAYDGTTAAIVGTADDRMNGDVLTIARTAAFADQNAGNGISVAVSGVDLSGDDADNYTVAATGNTTADITPKVITINGLVVADKTYDGTDAATVIDWGSVSTGVGSETLVLAGTTAAFANANAGTGKAVTASGYALGDGSNGGLASNYQLSSTTATTTADIGKALLTVIANNDARFVTQTDTSSYNGVSYSGFVNGETAAVLGGTVGVSRANSGANTAGVYSGVLVADTSGLTTTNYSFQTQNGDYTIVGSNELLVRVQNSSATYGTAANHVIASVEYMDGDNIVYRLDDGSVTGSDVSVSGGNQISIADGAAGAATFTLTPSGSNITSTAGFTNVGVYQLGATGVDTVNANNFSDTITIVGSQAVTQKAVTANASGVSKVYDGTDAMTGVSLGLSGLVTGDVVSVSGNGAFSTHHAGTNLGYTISGIALGAADAGNYYLSGGSSFSGNDGTITPRQLTAIAGIIGDLSKTYDGTTDATGASVNGSVTGAIAGDTIGFDSSGLVLAYNSAHVSSATGISASGTAGFVMGSSNAGSLASDYVLVQPSIASANASITPRTLTATLTNTDVTKVYDGDTSAPAAFVPTWDIDGLVAGDTAAALSSTGATYDSKNVATASKLTVSGLSIASITGNAETTDYALDATSKAVAATITPKAVAISATDGISKVYDGTTAMSGVSLGLSGLVSDDIVTVSGDGAFDSKNVGTGLGYTVSNTALVGADAGNYTLSNGSSFSGNNGTITPKALTVTYGGVDKVYDGNTTAAVTTNDDRIAGDQLTITGTAVFADKNVGNGKQISIDGVTLVGDDAGNYTVATTGSAMGSITRRDTAVWVGPTNGNWFDPANWKDGAVPDLANVANVVIPDGVTVEFGNAVVGPAQSGPVFVDSLGTGGSLSQSAGELNVKGDLELNDYSQSGGKLTTGGSVELERFAQTGGEVAVGSDLMINGDFSQEGDGTVTVRGNVRVTDVDGGAILGNLQVGGDLAVTSTDGNITQTNGSAVVVSGQTVVNAGDDDVVLDGADNDFGGPFNAQGGNVTVTDGNGGLTLSDITAAGDLVVTSTDGDVTQTNGSAVVVSGQTTVNAGDDDVVLDGAGNDFGGPFNAEGDNVTVTDGNGGLMLGNIKAAGDLVVTSTDGAITQADGSAIRTEGNARFEASDALVILDSVGNNFAGGATIIDRQPGQPALPKSGLPAVLPPSVTPQPLPPPTLAPSIVSATEMTGVIGGSRALSVLLTALPTAVEAGQVMVGVPTEFLSAGFSFTLPKRLIERWPADAQIHVRLASGEPLPTWLRFDSATRTFTAERVEAGALPIEVEIISGEDQVIVVITAGEQ